MRRPGGQPLTREGTYFCMAVTKGDIVRAVREKLENSLEAQASDDRLPNYIFETKGEVIEAEGDYVLVKFGHVPTPNMWLRADQLEAFEDPE